MSLDLDAIKARCEAAATPSRTGLALTTWILECGCEPEFEHCDQCDERRAVRFSWQQADAEFIAHARTDVPALVAEVERLRAESEALKAERRTWGGGYRYICEEGHTTVTTEARYDVCTAVLPWSADHKGVPCGAPTEYRVIPYDAEFDL